MPHLQQSRRRPRTVLAFGVSATVIAFGVLAVVAPRGDSAPAGPEPSASLELTAGPERLDVAPGLCSPSTTQIGVRSVDGAAAYPTVRVTAPEPVGLSRTTFTTYAPAEYPALTPLDVVVPGDTPAGEYDLALRSGASTLTIPVTVTERPSGPDANLARGQETTASSVGNLTTACGVVDGNHTYTLEGFNRPPTAWADGSPGVFPDQLETRLARPAAVGRVDVHTHAEARFALRDWDVELHTEAGWTTVASVRGHTAGAATSTFPSLRADAVRITALATNGYAYAIVTEVEVYGP
ncbi:hypothetical protein [Jiangella mangrovi]|uniref:F5/8 type C domain-containing protein n=1 Tax=Jiangella mangrovi TaxID=1524084 RepID=A0A7W9GT28_9ACTN|nr:hypothetical protein [Jiangella mangrovi]MBB5789545.1 hypothetical protein [Jiangella mangrovi]